MLSLHTQSHLFLSPFFLSTSFPLHLFLLSAPNPSQKVAPLVESFTFPKNLTRGKRLRVICTITEGDRPLEVEWHKDGVPLRPSKNVQVQRIDEYTSLLGIAYLDTEHAGNYSCVASNSVAKFAKSAILTIRGKDNNKNSKHGHSVCLSVWSQLLACDIDSFLRA